MFCVLPKHVLLGNKRFPVLKNMPYLRNKRKKIWKTSLKRWASKAPCSLESLKCTLSQQWHMGQKALWPKGCCNMFTDRRRERSLKLLACRSVVLISRQHRLTALVSQKTDGWRVLWLPFSKLSQAHRNPTQEVTVRRVLLFTYGILFWIEYPSAVLAEGERGRVLHKENQQHRELSRGRKVVQAAGSSMHQQFTYRWVHIQQLFVHRAQLMNHMAFLHVEKLKIGKVLGQLFWGTVGKQAVLNCWQQEWAKIPVASCLLSCPRISWKKHVLSKDAQGGWQQKS